MFFHTLFELIHNKFIARRSGKTVYYALDDDHVREILESGLEHILHKQQYNVKQGK